MRLVQINSREPCCPQKATLARTRCERSICTRSGINFYRDGSALFAARRERQYFTVGISQARFREAILVSLPSLLLSRSPSVSLSRDRFTAFYTAIVFAEQPRYYMLKIIFYLGTSLTANLDAARGECLAFQALHSAEILRLSYRVQGCERNGCSMSFTLVCFWVGRRFPVRNNAR